MDYTGLTLLSLALFLSFCHLTKAAAPTISEECLKSTGVDPELIKKYESPDFKDDGSYDEKAMCYYKCVFEFAQILKPDGKVDVDTVEQAGFIEGTDAEKKEARTCLQNLPKISSCADIESMMNCMSSE